MSLHFNVSWWRQVVYLFADLGWVAEGVCKTRKRKAINLAERRGWLWVRVKLASARQSISGGVQVSWRQDSALAVFRRFIGKIGILPPRNRQTKTLPDFAEAENLDKLGMFHVEHWTTFTVAPDRLLEKGGESTSCRTDDKFRAWRRLRTALSVITEGGSEFVDFSGGSRFRPRANCDTLNRVTDMSHG